MFCLFSSIVYGTQNVEYAFKLKNAVKKNPQNANEKKNQKPKRKWRQTDKLNASEDVTVC